MDCTTSQAVCALGDLRKPRTYHLLCEPHPPGRPANHGVMYCGRTGTYRVIANQSDTTWAYYTRVCATCVKSAYAMGEAVPHPHDRSTP
jgi:hypothetical protein